MTGNYLKEVRNQYEEFPYPPVNPEDEKKFLRLPITDVLHNISHYGFGGMKDLRKNCRFLVAGGGTGPGVIALAEQLREHDGEIVYVDISEASQRLARERARIRGLEDRIQWIQGSLLSVAEMGIGQFDYINCSGVLHHLENPDEGLRALASVLKPDGVLGCMLYAKYGRLGIYQMQEALRLINHSAQTAQEKVDNAKIILNTMPESNWLLFSSAHIFHEMRHGGDAAIYDMFLHSQDRAYSVPELYDFVRNAGLEIALLYPDDFTLGKKQYDPALYIKDQRLLAEAYKLPLEKQQQLAELMNGKIYKHTFYASRIVHALPNVENPDMVPFISNSFPTSVYEDLRDLIAKSDDIMTLHPSFEIVAAYFPKTPHIGLFMKYLDGKRSMGELVKLVQASVTGDYKPTSTELTKEFRIFYNALQEYNWMLLRHKDIPPYEYQTTMQDRIRKKYA